MTKTAKRAPKVAKKVAPITEESLMAAFRSALPHAAGGLVLIDTLAQALGHAEDRTALHSMIMRLDREDKMRLVSIGDRSRATPAQLARGIQGENETFLWVEMPPQW